MEIKYIINSENEKTHVVIAIEEYQKLINISEMIKCFCDCDPCMHCDGNCKCNEVVCICK